MPMVVVNRLHNLQPLHSAHLMYALQLSVAIQKLENGSG